MCVYTYMILLLCVCVTKSVGIQGFIYTGFFVGGRGGEHWPVVPSQMILFVVKCICLHKMY